MPQPSDMRLLILALAAALAALWQAPLSAQGKPAVRPVRLTTPDGTRFVLVPIPEVEEVHWTVVTPIGPTEDPPGLAGLSEAVLTASLNGTSDIGTSDPDTEREVLDELDQVYADLAADPADRSRRERLAELRLREATLGDERVFLRLLAAAPAQGIRIDVRERVALLRLTTLPDAIAEVARLLVERRERTVLRGLMPAWLRTAMRRQTATTSDPMASVRAELLALAMPWHPLTQDSGNAAHRMPRRAQALDVWARTQHPTRTVQLLLGNIDVKATRTILERTFAATTLPAPEPSRLPAPTPLRSQRRSMVPGTGQHALLLGWVLAPVEDPFVLEAATEWLGNGTSSAVARHLARNGHKKVTVSCRAPWPVEPAGRGLLLLTVRDPSGTDGLAELVLAACAEATSKTPSQGSLYPTVLAMQREWAERTASPNRMAAELGRTAWLWPDTAPPTILPSPPAKMTAVHELLKATFAGQPVIVEAGS